MKDDKSQQEFALSPLSPGAYWFFPVAWLLLLAAAYLLPHAHGSMTDPVPVWLMTPFIATLALMVPFILLRRRHVRFDDGILTIAATFYTKKIAVGEIDLDKARVVNLDEYVAFKPMLRLNGYSLPGFRAGHYLLRDRSRAFCLLTDFEHVLVLPQRDGNKTTLLSPSQPQALLSRLREWAHG
jgi:ribose/xylose/arabinose/galactoside ABC-type transport system permease subunit